MRSLSKIAIERPVLAWMLMLALMVFGVLSYRQLGIGQMPDVDFPVVSASFSLQGAAPEVIEGQILDVVEDSVMQIGGVVTVNSTAQQGSGSISIEFELGRDIDQAVVDVKNQIDQVLNLLPNGTLPARIRKSNPEDEPILWLALTASRPGVSTLELMTYAKEVLQGQMSMISGVADVMLGGYASPMLRVKGDIDAMNRRDVSPVDLLQAIQSEHFDLPAGQVDDGKRESHLRVITERLTPEDFGKILIRKRASQGINYKPIRLDEVAQVEEGTADVRRMSRLNGRPAVGMGILKQHGSNAVAVADAVKAKVEELNKSLPKDLKLEVRTDFTRFVRQSVKHLLFTLLASAVLTSIVCLLFLGSWMSTLNVLLSIPTSIIGTFIGLYWFHFTLNIFTLLGLTLAIGIVVDDAIMMLENIVRHGQLGKSPKQAALEGSQEITFSAVAATVAVAAIFIPVIFMKGIIGRFF